MANPNIVNVTSIYGNVSNVSLTTTSATSLVSNAASSGNVLKVDNIVAANTSSSAATITINVYSAAALGGTAYPIASAISVPANSTLIVTDKSTAFYLTENMSVGAVAGTASTIVVTTSWEQIS
jgi:hypothetical protein